MATALDGRPQHVNRRNLLGGQCVESLSLVSLVNFGTMSELSEPLLTSTEQTTNIACWRPSVVKPEYDRSKNA